MTAGASGPPTAASRRAATVTIAIHRPRRHPARELVRRSTAPEDGEHVSLGLPRRA